MDEYALNLSASSRRKLKRSIGLPFMLSAMWILLFVFPGGARKESNYFLILAVALLILIYIAAAPLRLLFVRVPLVRFTQLGVVESIFGCGMIPWTDVAEVQPRFELGRGGPVPVLDLRLRNPGTYICRIPIYLWLALPTRSFRKGFLPIPFSDLDGQMDDAVDWIRSYHPDVYIKEPIKG